MTLLEKQQLFSVMTAKLILHITQMQMSCTLGEAHRPQAVADLYAEPGGVRGIKNSLHVKRLAIDINLFKNGKFLKDNMDYLAVGQWWEDQSTLEYKLCWGGRFGDGNHFSMEHEGVR